MNKINETNNKQETKLLRVEIADASGHQTLMLSPEETQELVEQQDNKWIFVDNTLIREVAVARIGAFTYAYNEAGFDKVLHVSGINPLTKTFRVESTVASVLEHVFHWNDTLKRLEL